MYKTWSILVQISLVKICLKWYIHKGNLIEHRHNCHYDRFSYSSHLSGLLVLSLIALLQVLNGFQVQDQQGLWKIVRWAIHVVPQFFIQAMAAIFIVLKRLPLVRFLTFSLHHTLLRMAGIALTSGSLPKGIFQVTEHYGIISQSLRVYHMTRFSIKMLVQSFLYLVKASLR